MKLMEILLTNTESEVTVWLSKVIKIYESEKSYRFMYADGETTRRYKKGIWKYKIIEEIKGV